jgi:hypothetical protein
LRKKLTLLTLTAQNDFFGTYDFGYKTEKFISKTLSDNRLFYQELLAEFTQYFTQTNKNAHTAAFIFLYRILERLSFSVPLLYASVSKDFLGTFKDLKDFILDDKGGELGFFKKFLNQGNFIDPNILDSRYTFRFISTRGCEDKYFKTLNKIYSDFEVVDNLTHSVECKFRNVPEMLKTIRNRFFHTRTGEGQYNISLRNLQDPDEFFRCVNSEFCGFLSIVTVHTLVKKYPLFAGELATI